MTVDVQEWLTRLSSGHVFGTESSFYGHSNLRINVETAIDVRMRDGKVVSVPAGCKVGIFREYKASGNNIVATIFRPDDQVVIREGGYAGVKRYHTPFGSVKYRTVMAYF